MKVTVSARPRQAIRKLEWEEKVKVRSEWAMERGAACTNEFVAYVNPVVTFCIYQYNYRNRQWSELPKCSVNNFALLMINGCLTTVGSSNSNKLFSYSGQGWVEKFPPMPTNCK